MLGTISPEKSDDRISSRLIILRSFSSWFRSHSRALSDVSSLIIAGRSASIVVASQARLQRLNVLCIEIRELRRAPAYSGSAFSGSWTDFGMNKIRTVPSLIFVLPKERKRNEKQDVLWLGLDHCIWGGNGVTPDIIPCDNSNCAAVFTIGRLYRILSAYWR
jgi:hypothetical protein